MPLLLNDVILKAIIKEADKLGLDDTASVSIGVWTHVPVNELTIFNMPEFRAVIKLDLDEIRDSIKDLEPELSRRKYRPANGTEGDIFMNEFCDQCKHEGHEKGTPCPIIGMSMALDVDEDGYPEEWQYGADGEPKCTKFDRG